MCSGLAPVYPFLVPVSVILISTMCARMRSYDQFFRSREESSRLALAPSLSSAIGSGRVHLWSFEPDANSNGCPFPGPLPVNG